MEGHCKAGDLKRKKSGQTKCQNCQTSYNNKAIPRICSNKSCNSFLGGKFVPKPPKPGAFLITDNLASVRLNEKGTNVRTFVSIGQEKKVC